MLQRRKRKKFSAAREPKVHNKHRGLAAPVLFVSKELSPLEQVSLPMEARRPPTIRKSKKEKPWEAPRFIEAS